MTIGRGEAAHIRVLDDGVSRQHSRLYRTEDAVVIEDLGSANGTFVNGTRVTRCVLNDGDKVSIGQRTTFRFTFHDVLDERFQRSMYENVLQNGLYRALFTSSPLPTFLVDAETLLIFAVNAAAIATYGYSENEFRAMTIVELSADPERRDFALDERQPAQHRTKGQVVLDVELITRELVVEGRRAWLSIANDLTERKKLEGRLRVADRMASVGTLAAGVAHEINNPLTYVKANLAFVAERLREAQQGAPLPRPVLDELLEVCVEADEGAEKIRGIVRDLKSFTRTEEVHVGSVDIHHVLDGAVNMALNEIRHRATLIKDYAPTDLRAFGQSARLGQVFLNLLVNAAQAITEGSVERNTIRVTTREDAESVIIEIADSGSGIEPEIVGRLFDPFFTTKVGVGTGLGLSICHGIVEGHRGRIEVESVVGRGSVFRVVLPRAGASDPLDEPGPRSEPFSAKPMSERCRNLLVVDDDEKVAAALRRILREHEVTIAQSGAQALALIEGGRRFDAILCDLMMPSMTGMDLHQRLMAKVPDQAGRMIFVTGGAFSPRARAFLDEVPNERLDKPVDRRALQTAVRRVARSELYRGRAPKPVR